MGHEEASPRGRPVEKPGRAGEGHGRRLVTGRHDALLTTLMAFVPLPPVGPDGPGTRRTALRGAADPHT